MTTTTSTKKTTSDSIRQSPPPPRLSRTDASALAKTDALPLGERIRLRLQPFAKPIVLALQLLRVVVSFVLDYALAFTVATMLVPGVFATLAATAGLQEGDSIDLVIAGWIAPSLFLMLVLLVGTLWVMRGIWRLLGRPIARVKRGFALEDQDNGR